MRAPRWTTRAPSPAIAIDDTQAVLGRAPARPRPSGNTVQAAQGVASRAGAGRPAGAAGTAFAQAGGPAVAGPAGRRVASRVDQWMRTPGVRPSASLRSA